MSIKASSGLGPSAPLESGTLAKWPGRNGPMAAHSGRQERRRAAERHGRLAEIVAAAMLVAMGYRILARRMETAAGEIDLVAVRGRRIAFIEVKKRAGWVEAGCAVRRAQTRRMHRAANLWVAARPYYTEYEHGFDCILVVPWSWPDYRRDALQPA